MAYILNIETATRNCSVALAKDGEVIALREIAGEGYLHAEKLHIFIEEAIKEAGILFTDVTAIAVSKGPGSYTGLRIGVSAAKGLCYALNIPLISIDTMEVLARNIEVATNDLIVPMIDARRMEAYTAIFDHEYNNLRETKAEILTADLFANLGEKLIHFTGDSVAKAKTVLSGKHYVFHEAALFPSAAQMCAVSYDKHKKSDIEDVAYFEPFYLKDFIAGKN